MAFHHVAIATRDLEATHRFFSEACGFELVNVDVIPYLESGWARHAFYDTGNGEMIAVWDLHDEALTDFDAGLSTAMGLPTFVNHIAFASGDLDDLDARKDRWLEHGHDVVRVDHGWCTSIYANDPDGTMIEFCCTTRVFGTDDVRRAHDTLLAAAPEIDKEAPAADFFLAEEFDAATAR
ncbi:MAG: VOC family protein [Actinobacteria bacterium]|nr:VOC family protein [Actinomycetota bacterium]